MTTLLLSAVNRKAIFLSLSLYFESFLRFMKQIFYLLSIKDPPHLMTSSDMGIGCLNFPSHQADNNWRIGGNTRAVFGWNDLEG